MRAISMLVLVGLTLVAPAEAKRLRLHKPPRGFQMRMTPFPLQPGEEREVCEYLTTPNKEAMDVAAFEMKTTPGTHHFVVWEYLGKDHNPADFWSGDKDAAGCV